MVVLNLVIWGALILYLLIILAFYIGTFRGGRQRLTETPFASVIVAARNEEAAIGTCIQALADQTCPAERYEIIVVNDRSEDNTAGIVKDLQQTVPNLRLHTVTEKPKVLAGKQNALDQGIELANGEVLLITDADCRAPRTWVESMARCFTPKTGLVCAYTIIGGRSSLWNTLQSLDLVYLLTIAKGAIGLGNAISCIGNNFGFRKSVYNLIGGFKQIGFSITEDFAICQAVKNTPGYDVVFNGHAGAVIRTDPMETFGAYLKQRKRWGQGGLRHGLAGPAFMLFVVIIHALIVASFVMGIWHPLQLVLGCMYFFIYFGINLPFLWRGCSLIKQPGMIGSIIMYEFFAITYSLILGVMALNIRQKVVWKKDAYTM